ncbi:CLUMA_CG006629, isoform A [Clunio marinus]|uniref:CLUMA_CG006629, isoform A n=1 Tax=Clunio marinus TaxID=568069 RepID=A0A1J1I2H9_9DIPT|nr:CLUMA_CG006629, isoform A [Clunio marinus]
MKQTTVSKIQREYFNRQAFLQKFTERDLLVPYSRLVQVVETNFDGTSINMDHLTAHVEIFQFYYLKNISNDCGNVVIFNLIPHSGIIVFFEQVSEDKFAIVMIKNTN